MSWQTAPPLAALPVGNVLQAALLVCLSGCGFSDVVGAADVVVRVTVVDVVSREPLDGVEVLAVVDGMLMESEGALRRELGRHLESKAANSIVGSRTMGSQYARTGSDGVAVLVVRVFVSGTSMADALGPVRETPWYGVCGVVLFSDGESHRVMPGVGEWRASAGDGDRLPGCTLDLGVIAVGR